VSAAPSVSITTPAEGGTYLQGQTVDAAYSCAESAGGPGLKPGSEGCSGTVANGAPIDTSTAGEHKFTVTATSQDGLTASKTVTYFVAAPPVFGRCLEVAGGRFANASCRLPAGAGAGKYEWFPGAGPKAGFELADKPSSSIVLKTTQGKRLLCTSGSGAGSVIGLKTATLQLTLTGCREAGVQCENTGTEGEIALRELTGTLVWSNKASKSLDLELTPPEEFLGSYHCTTMSATKRVQLYTNGILLPVKINKAGTTFAVAFKQEKGVQKPDAPEGEASLSFKELREEGGASTEEGVGLMGAFIQTYEEAYEINTSF
jgi:hypothetical protein